jgi:hypothetical protein
LASNQTIIRKENCYVFGIGAGGKIGFYVSSSGWKGSWTLSQQTLQTNTWYHIVGVWDGAVLKVYVNGVADANTYAVSGTITSNTNAVYFASNGGSSELLNGTLDEVKLYNYAWDTTRVILIPCYPNPTYNNHRPQFHWYSYTSISNYLIQIDTNQQFTSPIVSAALTDTFYSPTTDLPFGTIYWRVGNKTDTSHLSLVSSLIICDTMFGLWVQTSGPSSSGGIWTLAVNGSNIFAGTNSGGVFLSTDNGNNWTAVNSGLTNNTVNVLTVSGNNIFAGTNGGLFLSKNNGTSWTAVNTGLTNDTVNALAVSGSNIFAGTNGGVFLSADSGNNWTATANTSTTWSLWANGPNIFAGMSSYFSSGTSYPNPCPSYLCSHSVFSSTNSGTSWNLDSCGFPVPCECYSSNICWFSYAGAKCLTVKDNYLFAGLNGWGVFFSTNSGGTSCWTQVNTGLTNTNVNALAVNGTDLFAGTNGGGVYVTTTNGSNWNAVNTGLTDMNILSFAVGGNYLFAGTDTSGVWRRPLSYTTSVKPSRKNSFADNFSFNLLTHNRSNLTIAFSLPRADKVMVKIYNLSGHLIATLLDKPLCTGPHIVSWDTRNVASGCYMVRMQAGRNSQVKALPLFR